MSAGSRSRGSSTLPAATGTVMRPDLCPKMLLEPGNSRRQEVNTWSKIWNLVLDSVRLKYS